jgi:tetratricopeptide (TPR) repeat protein
MMMFRRVFLACCCGLLAAASAAAQTTTDPVALAKQARKIQLEGRIDEAIALYREALMRAPEMYEAFYGLGIALDLKGSFQEAHDAFVKAIQIAPEESKEQALGGIAVSYAFSHDVPEAASFYRQLYDRQMGADNFAAAAETANALGRVYLETGDLDNAFKWYQTGHETSRRQGDMTPAQIDLSELRWSHAQARIAARRGDAAGARAHAANVKALIDKGGNDDQRPQYPYLIGYVDLFLKDYPGAIASLKQAAQDDPFVLFLLARAYEQSGNAAAALATYKLVVASNAHSLNNAFARAVAQQKVAQKIE